jgi:hypothetical protein
VPGGEGGASPHSLTTPQPGVTVTGHLHLPAAQMIHTTKKQSNFIVKEIGINGASKTRCKRLWSEAYHWANGGGQHLANQDGNGPGECVKRFISFPRFSNRTYLKLAKSWQKIAGWSPGWVTALRKMGQVGQKAFHGRCRDTTTIEQLRPPVTAHRKPNPKQFKDSALDGLKLFLG